MSEVHIKMVSLKTIGTLDIQKTYPYAKNFLRKHIKTFAVLVISVPYVRKSKVTFSGSIEIIEIK